MIEFKYNELRKSVFAFDGRKIVGVCQYQETDKNWNIVKTKVDSNYQGQGIAKKLVLEIYSKAKQKDMDVIADCSYAKKVLQKM